MKIVLEFDDQYPEELRKLQKMLSVDAFIYVIDSLLADLRDEIKFKEINEERRNSLEEMRNKIFEQINENELRSFFV